MGKLDLGAFLRDAIFLLSVFVFLQQAGAASARTGAFRSFGSPQLACALYFAMVHLTGLRPQFT